MVAVVYNPTCEGILAIIRYKPVLTGSCVCRIAVPMRTKKVGEECRKMKFRVSLHK